MNLIIKQEIENVMLDFSNNGKVFFNEAHFQSEFTIKLSKRLSKLGNYNLTLEYSPNFRKYRADLLIADIKSNEKIIIEFKYVVKKQLVKIANSNLNINLKSQGAYDVRRYQIWKDISKIEDLINNKKCSEGYFILLTNADNLINPLKCSNISYYFDISNGSHPLKAGTLYWNQNCPKYKSGKTTKRYPNKISISKTYNFSYINYITQNYNNFKYLILPIY